MRPIQIVKASIIRSHVHEEQMRAEMLDNVTPAITVDTHIGKAVAKRNTELTAERRGNHP